MLDLDGAILIMVMVILITHIMDGGIIHGTVGADTQVTDGVDTLDMVIQVMVTDILMQRLMPIITAEEDLLMVGITMAATTITERLPMPEIPFPTETAVSIAEIAL